MHVYGKIWCVSFELQCLHDLLFVNFNVQLLGAEELFLSFIVLSTMIEIKYVEL